MNIANLINEQKKKFQERASDNRQNKIAKAKERYRETSIVREEKTQLANINKAIQQNKERNRANSFAGKFQKRAGEIGARIKAKSQSRKGKKSAGFGFGSSSPNIFTAGSGGTNSIYHGSSGTNSIYHGTSGNNNPFNFSSSKPKAHKKGKQIIIRL